MRNLPLAEEVHIDDSEHKHQLNFSAFRNALIRGPHTCTGLYYSAFRIFVSRATAYGVMADVASAERLNTLDG
jgi:hypothetical protein